MDSRDNRQRWAWHDITAIGQHTVGRLQAFHDITDLWQHTRSDYVRHGMTSSPLYGTHDRTTSSVAFHYRLWAAQKVELRRAWHAIIAFGKHTRSTSSSVESLHRLWIAQPVERSQAWHVMIAFGKHTRSNDVGGGMPSSPLGSTNGRTAWGVACHHRPWTANTVERRRVWYAFIAFG